MKNELIKVTIENHVALVRMDAPPVNAWSLAFTEEFLEVFDELYEATDLRAVLVTGRERIFSAGADIKQRGNVAASPGNLPRHMRRMREVSNCVMEMNKPVIAAVNGPAMGVGMAPVINADIILASDNAFFCMPEIDIGLMGGAAHTMSLFPHSLARRMILTGYRLPAAEAWRRGIIEACLPLDELLPAAMAIATDIASKSPKAISLAKRAINTVRTMPLRDGYRFEQNLTNEMTQHEDSREAMRAFLEKRKPVFKDAI